MGRQRPFHQSGTSAKESEKYLSSNVYRQIIVFSSPTQGLCLKDSLDPPLVVNLIVIPKNQR